MTLTNAQILDTVRKYAPNDYQQRIPATTQGSVVETLRAMNHYSPAWDVFWNVFLARIGRVQINDRMNFTNPLAKLKSPTLRYGRTIQEVQANLIKPAPMMHMPKTCSDARAANPTFTRFSILKIVAISTLSTSPWRMFCAALLSRENPFRRSLISLTAAPIASANNDEYLLMRSLLGDVRQPLGLLEHPGS